MVYAMKDVTQKIVRIGCAAGFAGDRIDGSDTVISYLEGYDGPRYMIFELLAERTLAITKALQLEDPTKGYSPFLEAYLSPVIKRCFDAGIKIVTNAGASNPIEAGRRVQTMAKLAGISGYNVAVVDGDNLLEEMAEVEIMELERADDMEFVSPLLSANVYMGAEGIVEALQRSANIVITGRVSDPALALGPLIHEFDWAADDWDRLAAGTLVGHIIECGCQATGAAFIDPGHKDERTLSAPGLSPAGIARLGYPIAEVAADGGAVITKQPGSGGLVSPMTIKEQMLYEIHDPTAYITPDVVLDLSSVEVKQEDVDRVSVTGARGTKKPEKLKVTVSCNGGWLAEAGLSYAGSNSLARARFAIAVLEERIRLKKFDPKVRFDIIGLASVLDDDSGDLRQSRQGDPDGDYRIRAAVRTENRDEADWVVSEVLALWAAGPAGAAGFRESVSSQVFTGSALVCRTQATRHRVTVMAISDA